MKTLGLTFLLFCLLLIQSYAQSVGLELLKNDNIDRVLQDINKAKDIEDKLRVKLVSELYELVPEDEFTRTMIFGNKEQYLNKGMSANFKKEPKSMKLEHDRDPNMIEIEDKHVYLYAADYNLRVLESLQESVLALKVNPNELDVDTTFSNAAVYDKIISTSLMSIEAKYKIRLNDFDVNIKKGNGRFSPQTSYPYDGQLNFYLDSYTSDYGYIISAEVTKEASNAFNFKAKWINTEGKFVYTDMHYESSAQILYMQIPKTFLQPNKLYELEIVTFNSNQIEYGHSVDKFYRYLINRKPSNIDEELVESKVLTSIYFRTSMHRTLEDKIKGDENFFKIDKESQVSIHLQEPFAEEEIKKENIHESLISFRDDIPKTSSDLVYDVKPYYYLHYPQYEVIDTNNFQNKLRSEIDHTINADYIRKMKMVEEFNQPHSILRKMTSENITIPESVDEIMNVNYESYGPRITKEIFESKKLNLEPTTINFEFPKIKASLKDLGVLQKKIIARMEERAKFYQYADIVFSKRNGDEQRKRYEEYLLTEQENLPAELKGLLNLDSQKFSAPYMFVYIDYLMPGFETTITKNLLTVLLK